MAATSTQLIVDALSRAAAAPAGLPLYGSKCAPGLFAATAPAKEAAQQCKDSDYLRVVRSETRGKSTQEVCTLTEKGMSYLLGQASPKQLLFELLQAFDARKSEVNNLVVCAQQMQATLDALKGTVDQAVQSVTARSDASTMYSQWLHSGKNNGDGALAPAVLAVLEKWHVSNALEDCPLPELYRRVQSSSLTIGQFHDVLRKLAEEAKIYLHPWTGPLSELPEPPCALMVGHEIAYYASIRK